MASTELPRALCVSLHDVAPATWPACERLLAALRPLAPAKLTLLVVPAYHGGDDKPHGDFRRALDTRVTRGDELALHGFYHRDDEPVCGWRERLARHWYTAGEGEFAALDAGAAQRRIEAGLAWFAQRDWPVRGFVAPAWLMSTGTWKALRRMPLDYTTTLRSLHRLSDGAALAAQSLVYSVRRPWRRQASRWWNAWLAGQLQHQPLLRLSLHPADAYHPAVMEHWRHLLEAALHDGRALLTKAEYVSAWQTVRPPRLLQHLT